MHKKRRLNYLFSETRDIYNSECIRFPNEAFKSPILEIMFWKHFSTNYSSWIFKSCQILAQCLRTGNELAKYKKNAIKLDLDQNWIEVFYLILNEYIWKFYSIKNRKRRIVSSISLICSAIKPSDCRLLRNLRNVYSGNCENGKWQKKPSAERRHSENVSRCTQSSIEYS